MCVHVNGNMVNPYLLPASELQQRYVYIQLFTPGILNGCEYFSHNLWVVHGKDVLV